MQIHEAIRPLKPRGPLTLYQVVDTQIHETAALAIYNRNYIVNNVPADLLLQTDDIMISTVLNKLFDVVIRHAQNSVVLISARVYGMTVLLQVKTRGSISPALPEDLGHACAKAQKTGGIVEMIQCEKDEVCLGYCFLNVAGAA